MTDKVYRVLSFKASLLLLASKPLKQILFCAAILRFYKVFVTGMTNKVYFIRLPFVSRSHTIL